MAPKPIRIACLMFVHETVTFLKNDTTVEDFIYEGSPAKGEALLNCEPKSYMGGFVKVAREFDEVELYGVESPLMPKTGTGSGWVTNDAFELFVGRMIAELKEAGPFDGVFMALHGAMGVRGIPRPEAELARRVREVVGPGVPMAATFDPHGNEDEEFHRYADLGFTVKYFPHYDSYLQGERAARTLVRTIRGEYKPAVAITKVPILTPTVMQWTGASPWMDLVQRALTWEAREPDVYVNFFFGFPWADVPDVGMTFQAQTNGNPALARKIVEDLGDAAWRLRDRLVNTVTMHTIKDGVAMAKDAVARGQKPVVLADHSDRSGYATWVLDQVIAQDLAKTLIVTVADRRAIEVLTDGGVKVGDDFNMEVGGLADESAGNPVRVTGTVVGVTGGSGRRASDGGQTWVSVRFGNDNVLVISPYLVQVTELSNITALGIDPADFDVFAIKSRVHFRRGFDDSGFAKTILLVEPDEPYLGTVRLEGLDYKNVDIKRYYPYGQPEYAPATSGS